MPECKVGVVGAGKMGEYHIGVLSEMPATDLVGIVDSNQERAKTISERYNVHCYSDYKDIISKVDVVVIAVPTSLHYLDWQRIFESWSPYSFREALYRQSRPSKGTVFSFRKEKYNSPYWSCGKIQWCGSRVI